MYWSEGLDAPPLKTWKGHDGIVTTIIRELNMSPGSRNTVLRTLSTAWECYKQGVIYDGSRKPTGRKDCMITDLKSLDACIVADCMEQGMGLTQTMHMVNVNRGTRIDVETGLPPPDLGRSAVYYTYLAMQPFITTILKSKQGSTDPESAWAIARYVWVTQLGLRLGIIKLAELPEEQRGLPWFTNLPPLETTQMAHWDETHKKLFCGGKGHAGAGANKQVRFRRDEDGKVDNENGDLAPDVMALQTKYSKEVGAGVCLNC